jgi:hypothetical protein
MSTAWGRSAQDLIGPLFVASKQLLMPAMFSSKLVCMVVRMTTLASLSEVQAVSSPMWLERRLWLTYSRRRSKSAMNLQWQLQVCDTVTMIVL